MRRIGLLFILMAMLMVSCNSGAKDFTKQLENEEPSAKATELPKKTGETDVESSGVTDDPLQVRDRDWKQGNTVDPAVTIIEYGDFQ